MSSAKQHVSLVICGHVDAGKSTTTGRLIFELGGISDREKEKLEDEARKMGKASFAFAFFMDKSKEERARGVTIACTTKEFYTEKYHYTIIDAPGHRDFIKNMISGASQADVALLMIPADGNFTNAIRKADRKKGQIQGQSRQHAQLLSLLGVKQLIVGCNKMDVAHQNVKYSEARFKEVSDEAKNMLKKVGWKKFVDTIPYLPLSGYNGDNLNAVSANMPWYKGQTVRKWTKEADGEEIKVHTLVDCLNDYVVLPKRKEDLKTRMPVSGIYKIKGVGDVITGRVEQGCVRKKDLVAFYPSHGKNECKGVVNSIEMHHTTHEIAHAGDNVGLNLKGLDKENMPKTGDVMCKLSEGHLPAAEEFTAKVQVLQVPNPVKVGYSPIGFIRTARAPCAIKKLIKTTYKEKKNKIVVDDPVELKANSTAVIVFKPTQPICVETAAECEGLGRIALLEGNGLVMMGSIQSVVHKDTFKDEKKK